MIGPRVCRIVLVVCCLTGVHPVFAGERYLTVYAGRYTDDKLGEVLVSNPITVEHSWLGVAALAYLLGPSQRAWQWEFEAQLGKHGGAQTHWELNAVPIIRWKRFPWNDYLRTTVALGDGLSWANRVPRLERESPTNHGATRLLNYILVEVTVAPPAEHRWSIVMRMHHRSGVYGLFNDVHGGSTVIGVGLKFRG